MRIRNWSINSLSLTDGATEKPVPIFSKGNWFDGPSQYFRSIVFSADHVRFFGLLLINFGGSNSEVTFLVFVNGQVINRKTRFTLAAGEEIPLFYGKQLVLGVNDHVDLYGESTDISLLVSGYSIGTT